MRITTFDPDAKVRKPTVWKNNQMGMEYYRSCTWEGDNVVVQVEAVAFVMGLRVRQEPDGSQTLLAPVTRFDRLREGEFLQPVEKAVFLWTRTKINDVFGNLIDKDVDYSDEIGGDYPPSVEQAENNCKRFLEGLDFRANFAPEMWQ